MAATRARPAQRPAATSSRSRLVFGAGTGSLAIEICASRLLAPYFGSSTIVWANLIGLVLLALSLGYWFGGKLADRRPSRGCSGGIVVGAAVLVAVIPFVTRPILDVAAEGLDELSAGAVIGSFFATLLLFAPPVVLLGMVSPFAIRLALDDVGDGGRGRRPAVRALDRRQPPRHVPAGARAHPADRHPADAARLRRRARA